MAPNKLDFTKISTIKLFVGEKETEFKVTSNILLRSNFLKKKLETMLDTGNIGLNLPRFNPEAMTLYLAFIHTGPHKTTLPNNDRATILERYTELAMIYIISKELDDLGARNDVAIAMINLAKTKDDKGAINGPGPKTVGLIYRSTLPGSPIRRLLVDLWIPSDKVKQCVGNYALPPEFMKDVIKAITAKAEMEPGSLSKVLEAMMGIQEVRKLPNQAVTNGMAAYMES